MSEHEADHLSDEDLMVRIQKGNHQAFATLVRRRTSMFYACAYRQCSNQDLAEDAVQDAFLKLWANPKLFDVKKNVKFTTWFYRVVVNVTIDRMRKLKNTGGDEALEYLSDDADGQDTQMIEAQNQKALERAMQALPQKQKTAITLCFYEGLSNKEAAEILGVGVKALESLLMRGKNGLKDFLTREGVLDKEKNYGS